MSEEFDLESKFSVVAMRPVTSEDDFRTKETGELVLGRQILVGLDADDLRHLLVPVSSLKDVKIEPTHALSVQGLTFAGLDGDGAAPFARIRVTDKALNKVFTIFCEDYLARLKDADSTPMALLEKVVNDWRRLLVKGQVGLGREGAMGLIGELIILRELVLSGGPDRGFETWRDGSRRLHDFAGTRAHLEVKTTPAGGGRRINIGTLEQLDPSAAENLHLAVVELNEDENAPSLVNRMTELQELGLPASELLRELQLRGFAVGIDDQDKFRFEKEKISYWKIDEDFPSLQRRHLPEQVLAALVGASYRLAPDEFPDAMTESEVELLQEELLVQP